MTFQQYLRSYMHVLRRGKPYAAAYVRGHGAYAALYGEVYFLPLEGGTLVLADFQGLPGGADGGCGGTVHGFHIHAGTSCTGTEENPYADADGHFNPGDCTHPHHAGDLPPLFENDGSAFMAVATNRFRPEDVVGRTVIVHRDADDFHTQPSGNAGPMIACGEIVRL